MTLPYRSYSVKRILFRSIKLSEVDQHTVKKLLVSALLHGPCGAETIALSDTIFMLSEFHALVQDQVSIVR